MNRLQNLTTPRPLFVTLNPDREPEGTLGAWDYDHPLFDREALQAQSRMSDLQARDRIAFAGAYMRFGFHEDGLMAGYQAADAVLQTIHQPEDRRHPASAFDTVGA